MFQSCLRISKHFAALAAFLAFAPGASAQHNDALVFQNGGKVELGQIDVDCFGGVGAPGCNPNAILNTVYEGELLEAGTPVTGNADEPGFFAIPSGGEASLPGGASILPGNADHSINLILAPNSPVAGASVLFWDGTGGSASWSAMPNNEYFVISGINATSGTLNGTNEVTGIELNPTAANGSFDTHPDFQLFGNGGAVDPSIGFYALFGQTNIAGLTSSDAWAAVFDFGVENEPLHEIAADSVAGFLPEPSVSLMMGIGLLGLTRAGRRS
jgi:hypothetical protein